MDKKIITTIIMCMFMITLVSAAQDNLGTYAQGEDIVLLQICGTCSYNNITSIVLPNSTHVPIDDEMTKRGMEYTYTFTQSDLLGDYSVNGFGDLDGTDNAWAYDFTVTTTGKSFTEQKSIFYVGSMIVLCFLFVMSIWGITALPSGTFTQEDNGEIIGINTLRHFRIVLGGISWGILTMLSYLAFNVARAYLETGLVAGIFQVIFTILMTVAIIGTPVILAYIVLRIIQDVVIKKQIERGVYNND